jgi:hypothetical protein
LVSNQDEQTNELKQDELSEKEESGLIEHLRFDELPDSVRQAIVSCPECATSLISGAIRGITSGSVPGAVANVAAGVGQAGVQLAARTGEIHGAKIAHAELTNLRNNVVGKAKSTAAQVDKTGFVSELLTNNKIRDVISIGQERIVKAFNLSDGEIERIVDLVNSKEPSEVEQFIRSARTRKGDNPQQALERLIDLARKRFTSQS